MHAKAALKVGVHDDLVTALGLAILENQTANRVPVALERSPLEESDALSPNW